jgi:hypothetical protein
VTLADIAWLGVGCVGAFLIIIEAIARVAGMPFFSTVILGADGRTSTSKTFVLMWTVLVSWALVALLIAGEFVARRHCAGAGGSAAAAAACRRAGDRVGLLQVGWRHFLAVGVTGSYLVLLGIPGATAVTAKGITQSQLQSAPGSKTSKPRPSRAGGPARLSVQGFAHDGRALAVRLAEIFTDDAGATDIGDFQYLVFNLVTGVYFVTQFLHPDGTGLPVIPDTLLVLTGVSASLYVGKKVVSRPRPRAGSGPVPADAVEGDHDGTPLVGAAGAGR